MGTDGIALGANSVFTVDANGNLTATSGKIGNAIIDKNGLRASNGKWYINADGSSSFTDAYINTVRNGSYFGSVGYTDGITFGSFGILLYFYHQQLV